MPDELLQINMEASMQEIVETLVNGQEGVGYYLPLFIIKDKKVFVQEIGNIDKTLVCELLMYLFDQKTKEPNNGKERQSSGTERSH